MDLENLSELASLYVLGILDDAEQSRVTDQYAHLPDFQAEVAEAEKVAAMLAYQVDSLPMASDLKARLFQRIAETAKRRVVGEKADQKDAITALVEQAKSAHWEPYLPTPGVQFAKIWTDLEARRAECFVRSFGQVKFPEHRHAGDEEIVVLDGDLVIGDRIYTKGDRVYSQTGTTHQPETCGGCTLFLRTSLDDELL